MNNKKIWIKSILIPLILGGIVGIIVSKFMDYNTSQKPPLSPPGFLFGIVWSILYILMGISYGILETKKLVDYRVNKAYYLQLIINLLWPILFFVFKWRLFSCIWIILLIIAIIYMIIVFYRKNKLSAYLQIPYLLWTIFATYLNIGVYLLNRWCKWGAVPNCIIYSYNNIILLPILSTKPSSFNNFNSLIIALLSTFK